MSSVTETPAVHLVRTVSAPPERVYRAWLDPDLIRRWFAPGDYVVSAAEVDERVGGRHSVRQTDATGADVGGFESEFLELVPDRRIVLRWGFVGPDRVPDPAHDSRLTIEFAPTGDGRTTLTLRHERLAGLHAARPDVADNVALGWQQALANLEAVFPA